MAACSIDKHIHGSIHATFTLQSLTALNVFQGQEWTHEEDVEVMVQLRNIRQGSLSHKNMTVREAEKIQDVLKVSEPRAP